jgi:transcriptional regulator of heat shock response
MVRKIDHGARRRQVLATTINRYIQAAQPVASEDIAKDFDLSSATIRNIFAQLEEEGYLEHPYPSGGRIPTYKGWRYYVDFLIPQAELLDEEKECIIKRYEKEMKDIEEILEETSDLISKITHYMSIVSFLDWQDRFFYKGISLLLEQPEFHDLNRIRLLMKIFEDKHYLLNILNRNFKEKVRIYIGEELECAEINGCALAVSTYHIKDKPKGRLAVLGPIRMEYNHIIPTLEYVSEVLTEVLGKI